MFAIMTKVGVYALLRMGSLLAVPEAPAPFAGPWLFYGTVATMWFGIVGMLAARQLTRLVSFSVIASSGTLLAVIALGVTSATAPVLLYLIASVPAGTVVQVMQAGWIMHDRLLRPALVGIAKGSPAEGNGAAPKGNGQAS